MVPQNKYNMNDGESCYWKAFSDGFPACDEAAKREGILFPRRLFLSPRSWGFDATFPYSRISELQRQTMRSS